MKKIAILGSTGSIGTQTLNVLSLHPNKYTLEVLVAHSNWRLLEEQVRKFSPVFAVLTDPAAAAELEARVKDLPVQILSGEQALLELLEAKSFDTVVAAMVGHSGLLPVISAIKAGSDIALANKEVLVMAGHIVNSLCREKGVKLFPLDSEHSAIFQCLEGGRIEDVRKIILTASGGPFRGKTKAQLNYVTPADAVKHPNWQMGAKISVDSATLMNKGLEVIEARWLFDISPEKISVLVHPQSIIHSLVEFTDGSVLAQMGVPSMELPIQYALSWPERWPGPESYYLDWHNIPKLSFEPPDTETFPCLALAWEVLNKGGNAPAILSTANDICVESFLAGKLSFNSIPLIISQVLTQIPWVEYPDLESILLARDHTISKTRELIKTLE